MAAEWFHPALSGIVTAWPGPRRLPAEMAVWLVMAGEVPAAIAGAGVTGGLLVDHQPTAPVNCNHRGAARSCRAIRSAIFVGGKSQCTHGLAPRAVQGQANECFGRRLRGAFEDATCGARSKSVTQQRVPNGVATRSCLMRRGCPCFWHFCGLQVPPITPASEPCDAWSTTKNRK